MLLGIDAREIQDGVFTGIGRALLHFLRYFDEAMHQDRCVLFSSRPLPFTFGERVRNRIVKESSTLWWDQVLLPAAIDAENIEVFFSPYYKIPLRPRCRKISMVLDLMYLKYPSYVKHHSLLDRLYYSVMGRMYIHGVERIVTSSHYSKQDIVDIYGVDPGRIVIMPLGVSKAYRPVERVQDVEKVKERFNIRGRYLLYVGNFKPHKNVVMLVRAFALLSSVLPDLSLVLAAPKRGHEGIMALASQLDVAQRLVLTDTVYDEEELRLLYAGAEVFIFPSLYEGFGIPPVEAMACGTPVICADATCLPETCGGAGVLVDPYSPEDCARAVTRVMTDTEFRGALRSKGLKRAESLREEIFGRKLYDLCKDVAGYG